VVAALLLAAALSGVCVHAARAQDPDSLRAAERARQEKEREEKRDIFVNRILFVGNKGASAGELKARMRTREPGFFSIFRKPVLDERQVRRDVTALEAYYHSVGYPDATVHLDRPRDGTDVRAGSAPTPPVPWGPARLSALLARTDL